MVQDAGTTQWSDRYRCGPYYFFSAPAGLAPLDCSSHKRCYRVWDLFPPFRQTGYIYQLPALWENYRNKHALDMREQGMQKRKCRRFPVNIPVRALRLLSKSLCLSSYGLQQTDLSFER